MITILLILVAIVAYFLLNLAIGAAFGVDDPVAGAAFVTIFSVICFTLAYIPFWIWA